MKTPFSSRPGIRLSLVAALAAAALAGCGGSGGGSSSSGSSSAPTIRSQPTSIGANVGDSATFSVSASGSNVTYQWFKGTAPVTGATSARFTINPVGTADFGTYYVRVSNDFGDTNSGFVTLGLPSTGGPTITTQPSSVTTTSGSPATFVVVAPGATAYQWYRNGAKIDGATGASYQVAATSLGTVGTYYVIVSNSKGDTRSSDVTLSIAIPSAPRITTAPVSKAVLTGASTSFTVAASGSPAVSYQWFFRGTGATEFVRIEGATNATYTVPVVNNDTAGEYRVVVTNSLGSVSATAALTAAIAPTILEDIVVTGSRVQGGTITLTVVVSGTAPLTYVWRRGPSDIATTTVPTLTISNLTSANSGEYRVRVVNDFGSDTSDRATVVTVIGPPEITTQPASQTIAVGQTATFTVGVAESAGVTYQWFRGSGAGTIIAGATGASYTTPAINTAGTTLYHVVVTGPGGSTRSEDATLTVVAKPTITTQPASRTVTEGQTATFSVVASVPSGTLTYQWRKNGAIISGATSDTYTTPPTVRATDNGAQYTVTVFNEGLTEASVTSDPPAVLTVNLP